MLDHLEIDSPNRKDGVHYGPTNETYFRRMLRVVPMPPETYAFVDLGCGKGRALLLAAEYEFARVIGVDFSPELLEFARENIARFRARTGSTRTFELHVCDATTFDLPLEPLALYLYNPFGESVLRRVLERLHASLQEVPRDIVVLYLRPFHRQVFNDSAYLLPVKMTSQYCVYRSLSHVSGRTDVVDR